MLLHGFFGDRTTWRSAGYVDALAGDHRLVLVDARGHGGSDAPHDVDSYRIDRQVGDVVACSRTAPSTRSAAPVHCGGCRRRGGASPSPP
ncbi:alpha/beta fold hydrolase [Streptomyces luteogriseus]|uniref:alpha/beta fold hydrolase n=1 Tax=Streptomyces luteogriseus TaxID=68233 RepID=UPI003594614D